MLQDLLQKTELSDDERTTLETLYKAFNEQDSGLFDRVCSPDWQEFPLSPEQMPGPAGLKKVSQVLFTAFPDLKVEIHEVLGVKGRAAVRGVFEGTHQGVLFGVPATNKRIELIFHETHYFVDGRLARTYHVEDWFGLFTQIGHWPSA